ncbi:MAG: hypothetical protein Q4B85_14265, partial [Lachnospiraceae bacterium]|nr:hypothetical protein [Lachnospiraceae bacterium]
SGACGSNTVRVQVPLPALFFCQFQTKTIIFFQTKTEDIAQDNRAMSSVFYLSGEDSHLYRW